jgi:hypothetical protein
MVSKMSVERPWCAAHGSDCIPLLPPSLLV